MQRKCKYLAEKKNDRGNFKVQNAMLLCMCVFFVFFFFASNIVCVVCFRERVFMIAIAILRFHRVLNNILFRVFLHQTKLMISITRLFSLFYNGMDELDNVVDRPMYTCNLPFKCPCICLCIRAVMVV